MNFYKFSIYETEERLKYIEDNFSEEEKEQIRNIDCLTFDERISKYENISYIYADEKNINSIVEILYYNEVKFKYSEITQAILTEEYKFKDKEFRKLQIDYIENNIKLDDILDKIKNKGIDSLSELELNYLNIFSKSF
jgi:hypothetical protein